jgi:hypothetical protein
MNQYRDLVNKLEAISGTVKESVQPVEECGLPGMSNMPSGMMGAPKQADSVTMNVSMNGSGAGGIRDLMSILKNIESGTDDHGHADVVIGGMEETEVPAVTSTEIPLEDSNDGGFGSATTSPEQEVAPISAVTQTGNDMHSKGDEAEKVNGGGNPFNVSEGLMSQLAGLYQEVKLR